MVLLSQRPIAYGQGTDERETNEQGDSRQFGGLVVGSKSCNEGLPDRGRRAGGVLMVTP